MSKQSRKSLGWWAFYLSAVGFFGLCTAGWFTGFFS
jgi:hypothetical protein